MRRAGPRSARRRRHRFRRGRRPGVHRGGAQPQADGVHRAAGDHRGVRLRGPAPGPVRGVRLRPGVPVRAGPAAPGPSRDPAGPGPAPAGRDLDHGPHARGGGQVLLRVRGGRRVHGRARPDDGTHRTGAGRPGRSGDRTAGAAAAGELCAGRGGGQGAVRLRRPVRGRAEPRVLRAVRVTGRLLRTAPAAQPGAVRVPVQPGRGGVPGRRLARDVRPGHRGPGGDLPDRGHDRARRRTPWRTRRTSPPCSARPRRNPS